MSQTTRDPSLPREATSREVAVQHIKDSIETKNKLLLQADELVVISNGLVDILKNGGRIYSCGNGGSSCDAMHLTEELVARYLRERPGIPAQHFCDNSIMTCWSNDYSFDSVFERQVQTFVTAKDAFIIFSTSGNSTNILKAVDAANAAGALTVGFLGKGGGQAKHKVNMSLVVNSDTTARVQEAHGLIIHVLCELIETDLFKFSAQ